MKDDGSGQRRMTRNATATGPAWSPDGRKIAFVSRRDGNREVYVMNADGSGQRNLTRNAAFDNNPAWSPDGQKIAFVRGQCRYAVVYVMNANGSAQRRLTEPAPANPCSRERNEGGLK